MSEREEASVFRQTVSEGDIDWLFCVELNASQEFRRWVANRLFPETAEFEHIQAWRSITNAAGESDLLWLIESSDKGRALGLIENKIKATAQPEQYNRYVQRGQSYVEEGLCQQFSVALIAPEKYRSKDSRAYPIQLTYEEIVAWLQSRSDERSQYLASLYEIAINKLGTLALPDNHVSQFQEGIWRLASAEFPQLHVKEPGKVSVTQDWVYMRYAGYTIIYKMYKKNGVYTNCVIDLELAVRGDDVELLKEQYGNALSSTSISVEKAHKSAVFRLQVPAVAPPHFDEEKVRAALQAASELKAWWEKANAA